jgi:hypothetical protein
LGNTARHPSTSVPSHRKVESTPGRMIGKMGVLVNTPTLTWAYTRTFKERQRRDNRPTWIVSLIKQDAVYLNKKILNQLRKNISR